MTEGPGRDPRPFFLRPGAAACAAASRAFAGWRYLYTDYENDGFVFKTELNGPVLGATYNF